MNKELVTPEFLEEALKWIAARLVENAHSEAMAAERARCRKVALRAARTRAGTKLRIFVIRRSAPAATHVYAQRRNTTTAADDHNNNNSLLSTERKPGGYPRAFCLLSTLKGVRAD